jgi:hypothetical protein
MSHEQLLILVSVLVPLALVAVGMIVGWRTLRRRASDVTGLEPVPSEPGAVVLSEDLLYVATTRAEQPLQRIAVMGLGFRARAVLTVSTGGIRLDLAGGKPGFIPAAALHGVGRATWVIDRAVSHDGLVLVRWSQGSGASALDSYVRSADPAALVAAVETLIPTMEGAAA